MASAAPELPALVARDRAFEGLYRRYVGDVYHYALALMRDPAEAEDVTQTTFMNAYRAYKRGEEPIKPQNWLIKIAHNVARSRYARTRRRVKEVPLDDHVEMLALPEQERPNVEGVLRELGRLPFNQRSALVMRELEGRSYAEIAETLDVSVSAVETLIFRARRSLRLRASALRVITAVPLPSSLAHFFQGGGGVVAGGGAMAGTGFLVKATIALVAGAVATGIVGDKTRSVEAAPDRTRPAAVATTVAPVSGLAARTVSASTPAAAAPGRHRIHRPLAEGLTSSSAEALSEPTAATSAAASAAASGLPSLPGGSVPTRSVVRARSALPRLVQHAARSAPTLPKALPSAQLPPPAVAVPPVEVPQAPLPTKVATLP